MTVSERTVIGEEEDNENVKWVGKKRKIQIFKIPFK